MQTGILARVSTENDVFSIKQEVGSAETISFTVNGAVPHGVDTVLPSFHGCAGLEVRGQG